MTKAKRGSTTPQQGTPFTSFNNQSCISRQIACKVRTTKMGLSQIAPWGCRESPHSSAPITPIRKRNPPFKLHKSFMQCHKI